MRAWRAAIAVAALYALALQAVLGGASLAVSPDPAHVLCQQDEGGGEGLSKARASHGHPDCCLVAYIPGPVAVPSMEAVLVVWPPREAVAVIWRSEVLALPRGPPGTGTSARAPPVA
ncbi:hypothetical protein H0176_22635 [Methylorubrum populi]|jgi:hypothetical protein|uniref:DUF2946 domain-containing protein n=1 Tax=Methylorubrum rhodesianum TaxID=29427 RepID=A0ABU9Z8K0_9HYPH|nr:hypothetical protein [Methylorubrum rhodesianum]MBK3402806.1 hypothetical protein [Methylorubrum rhodesianum]MBY0143045.1 hypothetical protein [Methylorubrum populi]